MPRLLTLISIFIAFLSATELTARPEQSDKSGQSLVEQISTFVSKHAELDMFSGAVLVAKDGNIIYEKAFGEADKESKRPNTLDTKFNIGSIGKTFTAVSIMQLVEAGNLQLSDPLSKFLPDFPYPEKDRITIHNLLNHTSGLGDYLEHENYISKIPTIRKIDDVLPLVYDQKPEFQPGEGFKYSNSGYLLLGVIIQRVSGLSYPEYLERHIFKPLGMSESCLAYEGDTVQNNSTGYTKNWDGTYTPNVHLVPAPCSAGGLKTTVEDLLKFDQALLHSSLLNEESKTLMYTPSEIRPTYASGWEIKEYQGHKFIGHSGGADGVEAYFYRFIDAGYTIITFANYDGGNGQVCSGIEAIIFDQDYTLPTVADANFTLGYALQAEGKYQEAVRVFAKNISDNQPHLMSLFLSANSRIRGDFKLETALSELDQYIQLANQNDWPPVSMALGKKGDVLTKLGRTEEAVDSYQRVLELDPDNTKAKEKLDALLGSLDK